MGDIFYIFIGVVFCFGVFCGGHFCISVGRFSVWYVFWFWSFKECGFSLTVLARKWSLFVGRPRFGFSWFCTGGPFYLFGAFRQLLV